MIRVWHFRALGVQYCLLAITVFSRRMWAQRPEL